MNKTLKLMEGVKPKNRLSEDRPIDINGTIEFLKRYDITTVFVKVANEDTDGMRQCIHCHEVQPVMNYVAKRFREPKRKYFNSKVAEQRKNGPSTNSRVCMTCRTERGVNWRKGLSDK